MPAHHFCSHSDATIMQHRQIHSLKMSLWFLSILEWYSPFKIKSQKNNIFEVFIYNMPVIQLQTLYIYIQGDHTKHAHSCFFFQ